MLTGNGKQVIFATGMITFCVTLDQVKLEFLQQVLKSSRFFVGNVHNEFFLVFLCSKKQLHTYCCCFLIKVSRVAKNCFERDATTGLDKKRSFTEKKSCKI